MLFEYIVYVDLIGRTGRSYKMTGLLKFPAPLVPEAEVLLTTHDRPVYTRIGEGAHLIYQPGHPPIISCQIGDDHENYDALRLAGYKDIS